MLSNLITSKALQANVLIAFNMLTNFLPNTNRVNHHTKSIGLRLTAIKLTLALII